MTGDAPVRLIVIAGPTASGKTALALALAAGLNGEIIGADSRQIYRYMDIGTAKPTPGQRAAAPHHLIDIANPDETRSAAQIQALAYAEMSAIVGRGHTPMLVGGTGQYITAILEGWTMPEVPPDSILRADLERQLAADGVEALAARLIALDPGSKDSVDLRNPRRVIRALEVTMITGMPFSAQRRKFPPPYRVFAILLAPERDRLYQRADQRFDAMMDAGLLEETRRLLEMGYDRRLPAMSGLGYAQMIAHLQDGLPLSDAVTAAKVATHDFIRRQLTWFRKYMSAFVWHNPDQDDQTALMAKVSAWVQD